MHLRKITTVVLSSVIALSITTTNVFADTTGNITASTLNVRSGPSTSYKRVDSISKNSSVTILQESNGWYKVKLSNGNTGWISGKYVRKDISVQRSQVARDLKAISQGKVTASKLNVRSGPGTGHQSIGSLSKNNSVNIVQESNGWYKVKLSNGNEGWVSGKYVSKNLDIQQSALSRGSRIIDQRKVNAIELNIRKGPSISQGVIGILKKGNIVDVLENEGYWTYIEFGGKTGYVSSKYLVDISEQASEPTQILHSEQSEIKDSGSNNINYVKVSISLNSYISSEVNRTKKSAETLRPYINPKNYTINNKETFMQFLKLNKFRQIDVNKLNNYLNNLKVNSGKTNIFYEQGQAFINTAKKHNIDPVYLVAHTLVETGFGMSALAQGHEVILGEDGQAIRNTNKAKHVKLKDSSTPTDTNVVKVHNLFGIGAVDSAVISGGTTTAYDNSWTSIPSAIDGSAKWIRDNYIYRGGHAQDTLYKMRYNYVDKWHQYATDIGWATKISKHLNNLSYLYMVTDLDFEVPVYK